MYSVAPFFIAYLEALGVHPKNIIFSDFTDEEMFKEGSKRGAIDQCFPSKATLAHIHNLVYEKDVNVIFFPILLNLESPLENTMEKLTCPTVQATPEVCKAAFTKDEDLFKKKMDQHSGHGSGLPGTALCRQELCCPRNIGEDRRQPKHRSYKH